MPSPAHISNEDLRRRLLGRHQPGAFRDRDGDWMRPYDPAEAADVYLAPRPGQTVRVDLQTLLGGLMASDHPSYEPEDRRGLRDRTTRLMLDGSSPLAATALRVHAHPADTPAGGRVDVCLTRSLILIDCPQLDPEPVWVCACELALDDQPVVRYGPARELDRTA